MNQLQDCARRSKLVSQVWIWNYLQQIEKCWAGEQRLQAHIHKAACFFGIAESFWNFIKMGHAEIHIFRKLEPNIIFYTLVLGRCRGFYNFFCAWFDHRRQIKGIPWHRFFWYVKCRGLSFLNNLNNGFDNFFNILHILVRLVLSFFFFFRYNDRLLCNENFYFLFFFSFSRLLVFFLFMIRCSFNIRYHLHFADFLRQCCQVHWAPSPTASKCLSPSIRADFHSWLFKSYSLLWFLFLLFGVLNSTRVLSSICLFNLLIVGFWHFLN